MTPDEEFLKLARECEAEDYGRTVLFGKHEFITLCREVERRALEMAAREVQEVYGVLGGKLVRAMIKEKE